MWSFKPKRKKAKDDQNNLTDKRSRMSDQDNLEKALSNRPLKPPGKFQFYPKPDEGIHNE